MPLNPSENTERVRAQAIDLSRAWRHHYLGVEHLFAAACRLDGACGAALGGAALAALGPLGAFLFDGGTFCLSLVLILAVTTDLPAPRRPGPRARPGNAVALLSIGPSLTSLAWPQRCARTGRRSA